MMGSKSKEKGASGAFLADRVGSINDTGNVPLGTPGDARYIMLMMQLETGQMLSNSLICDLLQTVPELAGHVDDALRDFNDVLSYDRFSQMRATNFVANLRRAGVTPIICDIIHRQYGNYFDFKEKSKLSINGLCDKLRNGDSCDFNEYSPILVTLSDERIYGDFCTIYYNQDMYDALKFMDNLRENNRIHKSAKIAYALYFKNLFSKNPDAFIDQIQQYFVEKSQEYRQPHMGNDLFTGKERTSYADSVVFTSNMVKNCICEFFDESVVLKSKPQETWQHLSNLCLFGRNEKEIKWYTKQLQGELKTSLKNLSKVFASKDKDKIKEMLLKEKINLYALIHIIGRSVDENIGKILITLRSFIGSVDSFNKNPEDTKDIMNMLIDDFVKELNKEGAELVFYSLLKAIDTDDFSTLICMNFHESELFGASSAAVSPVAATSSVAASPVAATSSATASPEVQKEMLDITKNLNYVRIFMSGRNPENLQYNAYALYEVQRSSPRLNIVEDNTVRNGLRRTYHDEVCSKMQWTPIEPTNVIELEQNVKNEFEKRPGKDIDRVVIKLNSKFIVVEKVYGNTLFLDLETGKFLSAADLNAYSEGAKDIQIGRYEPHAVPSQNKDLLAKPYVETEADVHSALETLSTIKDKGSHFPAFAHLYYEAIRLDIDVTHVNDIDKNIRWSSPGTLSLFNFKEIVKKEFDFAWDDYDTKRLVIKCGKNNYIVAEKLHGEIIFLDPSKRTIISDTELTTYLKKVTEIQIGRYVTDL